MSRLELGYVGSKWTKLIPKFRNDRFRHAYFEKSLKAYIANQIRALRGDETQSEFGKRLGITQSVVSRLEDEGYGKLNAQTLIDIAKKLNLGLVIKFVDFRTFLEATDDISPTALKPDAFSERQLDQLSSPVRPKTPPETTTPKSPLETTGPISVTAKERPKRDTIESHSINADIL